MQILMRNWTDVAKVSTQLRCSGDKDGCERCIANGLTCDYTRTGTKGPRRGKKNSPRLSDSGRGSSSGAVPASPSTQDWPSPGRSRGSRSRQIRRAVPHGSKSPVQASRSTAEGVMSQLNFPSLSPEDGFDLTFLPDGSPLPPRTTASALPSAFAPSPSDPATMLAFTGLGSQTFPFWPAATGYDQILPTTSDFVPSYPATTAMPFNFTHTNEYPRYEPMGGYPDISDYSAIDPRFWPPTSPPDP